MPECNGCRVTLYHLAELTTCVIRRLYWTLELGRIRALFEGSQVQKPAR